MCIHCVMSYYWWHIKLNLQNLKRHKKNIIYSKYAVRVLNIGCMSGKMTKALKGLYRARTERCMDIKENRQAYLHSKAGILIDAQM